MENSELESIVRSKLKPQHAMVAGDGRHFDLLIVSDEFEGLNTLKRQQKVYAALQHLIASGELHALNIKALTAAEWQAK